MDGVSQGSNSWLDTLIAKAIDSRASDVHFEPEREALNVRFRIDGLLHQIESLNKFSQENILSKIKVTAK